MYEFDPERQRKVFRATGIGPNRTAVISVRVAVPEWANDVDAIGSYETWLENDFGDAVSNTSVTWEDGGDTLPSAIDDDEDDDEDDNDDDDEGGEDIVIDGTVIATVTRHSIA